MSKNKFRTVTLAGLAVISLVFLTVYFILEKSDATKKPADSAELQAARLMAEASETVFSCQKARGLEPEKNSFDVNRTGLIGLESSPFTTTLGNLQAKRTTTNPNLAALVVHLLKKAGVKNGDRVAMGASSSFPALIIASYCAARAMGVELLTIVSVGASQWGANQPEFSWLDIEECLRQAGFNQHRVLALSWGGDDDSGKEYPEDFRNRALENASNLNLKFLKAGSLEERVNRHKKLYFEAAGDKGIKAFINIGGSSVNLGRDPSILELNPGLTGVKKVPPEKDRGMIQEMSRLKIPAIHLLNIRHLMEAYNFPWDPQPLPEPGENLFWPDGQIAKSRLVAVFSLYILACLLWLLVLGFIRRKSAQPVP
jgi:poly-gamma-glutamate system protein